jgi:hypothetical protein
MTPQMIRHSAWQNVPAWVELRLTQARAIGQ